jgi:hypothetical protein
MAAPRQGGMKRMLRREFLMTLAAAAALVRPRAAHAQADWPARPARWRCGAAW